MVALPDQPPADSGPTEEPALESRAPAAEARIRLELGDCLDGMQALPADSIDVVITSPPYNLGLQYQGYEDGGPRSEYLDWVEDWARQIQRLLAPEGSFFLNVGSKPTDPLVPFQVLQRLTEPAAGSAAPLFTLQNTIHWIKSIAIMRSEVGNYPGMTEDLVVGHYKPINSPRFLNDCHEHIFHLTHRADVALDRLAVGVPYRDKSNVSRWSGGQDRHCRGNTWFLPYETIRRREQDRPHPATFPVELPLRCLRLHGAGRAVTVMDPFLVLGATAVAAARLGLDFIGFEIAPEYLDYARERVRAELL